MAKIDIHNYEKRLEEIIVRIKANDAVLPENKKTLMQFKDFMLGQGISNPRVLKLLDQLERISIWLGIPFKKASKEDIDRVIASMRQRKKKNGEPLEEWTKAGYVICMKRFYKWLLGNDEEYPAIVKHLKCKMSKIKVLDEKDIFTEQEIQQVIEQGCNTERDKAICALGYEGLCRIGELGSTHVSSLNFTDGEGTCELFGKTGHRQAYIRFSVPYLKRWLENHPMRNDPKFQQAPLFVMQGNKSMSYAALRKVLNQAIIRSGLVKKFHNPHLVFRKSRATHLALNAGLNERELMMVGGWTDHDSVSHYISKREVGKIMRKAYGLEAFKPEESKLLPITCSICGEKDNPAGSLECKHCHNPLSVKAAIERKMLQEEKSKTYEEMVSVLLEKIASLQKSQESQAQILERIVKEKYTEKVMLTKTV